MARSITHAGPKVGEREVVARHQKRSTRTDRHRAKRQWPDCGHAGPRLFQFVDKSHRSAKKQNLSSFDRRFSSHIRGRNTVRLLTRQRSGLVGAEVSQGEESGARHKAVKQSAGATGKPVKQTGACSSSLSRQRPRHVQGVFYRSCLEATARAFPATGWVRKRLNMSAISDHFVSA